MINSHEKTAAVRDSSKRQTLRDRLVTRLRNSKHLLLIIGDTTKNDIDWVPFEITYAIDDCGISVIAVYTDYDYIQNPAAHENEWPEALKSRIKDQSARVVHIPFKKEPITAAIKQFDVETRPKSALSYYTRDGYIKWGLIKE